MSESTADFGSDVKVMPSRSAYAVFPLMVDEKLCIKKRNLGYSTRRRTAKVCRFSSYTLPMFYVLGLRTV